MRTIYLIRHGTPAVPNGERICLSRTDLPLSPAGHQQGQDLRAYFSSVPLSHIFSSPLTRTRETAAYLSPYVELHDDLLELGVGCWEGLTFRDIREQYPVLYELRGQDPAKHVMPGGEFPADCQSRALRALQTLLQETTGDIAVVAHAGVNRLILCDVLGLDTNLFLTIPQPYGCINILYETDGKLAAGRIGFLPQDS